MNTDISHHLLTLAQWLSPAYPVGAFSYSHGLEWAVQDGQVSGISSFQDWLAHVLKFGAGRNDVMLLSHAYRSSSEGALSDIDALARALAPSQERLMEMTLQGSAFTKTTNQIWALNLPELTYPVAIGAAAARRRIPLDLTAKLFLQSVAGSLTSAAIRLVPLGQSEGQKCLADISQICVDVVEGAIDLSLDDIGSSAFLIDIASMKHETQYTRLFRS